MTLLLALSTILMASYSIAPAPGNRFTLEVDKTGLMSGKKHVFSFPKYSGTLQYNARAPQDSKVEFTLDGASMQNQDDWVKEGDREKILDLALNKMIEVKQYPEIRFVSGKIEQAGANHFKVSGALTMRGLSRPAVLDLDAEEKPGTLNIDGGAVVNMTDWQIKPPKAGLGAVGTKPEMRVRFQLVLTPAK